MKYDVFTIVDDVEYSATVSVRSDARMKTVFHKCAEEIAQVLWKSKAIPETVSLTMDLPNVWRNGCVGYLGVGGHCVTITQENGCTLAC